MSNTTNVFGQPVADPGPSVPGPSVPVADKPSDGRAKLRAFEDTHIGKDAPRTILGGDIERGSGSKYQQMTADQRAEHAALEKIVEAEKAVDDANVALSNAKSAHDAAVASLDAMQKANAKKAAAVKVDESKADTAPAFNPRPLSDQALTPPPKPVMPVPPVPGPTVLGPTPMPPAV